MYNNIIIVNNLLIFFFYNNIILKRNINKIISLNKYLMLQIIFNSLNFILYISIHQSLKNKTASNIEI
jgi:hypothetical protein